MGNNGSINYLDELIKNLEKLPNRQPNANTQGIMNNIQEYYSLCLNLFENYKKEHKMIFDNFYINKCYEKVKNKMKFCNKNYIIFLNSCLSLINEIKLYNEEIMNNSNFEETNKEIYKNNKIRNDNQYPINSQLMAQKEEVIQAQELQLLNDNQGRALSALENYSNRFTDEPTNYFDFYNLNNLASTKTNSQLRGQCIVQTQLFRMSFQDYTKKYGSYKIDNLDNEKLKNIINDWKQKVNKEDKMLYDEILEIIASKDTSSQSNTFNSYSKKCQNAKMDPKKIASMAPGVYNYNHQRTNQAKKKFLDTGKMESKLNIGKSYKDDKDAGHLKKEIESNMEYYNYDYDIDQYGDNK